MKYSKRFTGHIFITSLSFAIGCGVMMLPLRYAVAETPMEASSHTEREGCPQVDPDANLEALGIVLSGAIEKVIDEVMASNPKQLEQYRGGQDKLFGFFVGQVMKASQGKANPAQVNDLLKKKLGA